jgi:hypothetical protein
MDIVERLLRRADDSDNQELDREAADEIERLRDGLNAAIRAANLALFVIRKQGVMPNSSWESGFNSDLAKATAALTTEQKVSNDG